MFYYQPPRYKELSLSEVKNELDKITAPEMINLKELFNFIIERVVSCGNLYSFFIDTDYDYVVYIEVVEKRISFLKDFDFFQKQLTGDVENYTVKLNKGSPLYYIKLNYYEQNTHYSSIEIMRYTPSNIKYYGDGKIKYDYCSRSSVVEIFSNLVPYSKNSKTSKRFPINLKSLFNIFSSSPLDLCDVLLEFYSRNSLVFRDILSDYRNGIRIMPPVTIDEVNAAHNKRELIEKHLKCNTLKRDNALPFSVSYYIHKAENFINVNHLQELYSSDTCVSFCMEKNYLSEKSRVEVFFEDYFKGRLKNLSKDNDNILDDYVEMCLLMKRKIKINLNSFKALVKEHDRISDEFFIKNVKNIPTFKIPKSPLSKLKLPSEYVLIKNKKLLVQEALRMHHCVASYASKIKKGKCLIYTTLFEDKRYTIEITYSRNKYILRQCFGICNSPAPEELKKTLRDLLAEETIKRKKERDKE